MVLEGGKLINRIKIAKLRLSVYFYHGISLLSQKIMIKNSKISVNNIAYYPVVEDIATLADIVNRICWYIPQKDQIFNASINIPVTANLLNIQLDSLPTPKSQKRYISKSENIHFIGDDNKFLKSADVILLWDSKRKYSIPILKNIYKVKIVDPAYYFSVEAETYQRLFYTILNATQKEDFTKKSIDNFSRLLSEVSQFKKGYVFGSGPSLEKYGFNFDYSDGFRIVCNSIVKNEDLFEYIKPHVLAFGDAQHHASPCIYASTFRQNVLTAQDKFNFYIFTKDYFYPLLVIHYPEIRHRIIGIEAPGVWDLSISEILRMVLLKPHKIPWFDKIPGHDEEFNFPTPQKFFLRSAGSILPSYMIPLASTVCTNVFILGADGRDPNGRKPDDTYIWSYSSSCQYDDVIMQTAFETHPSYFRDRPFTEVMDRYAEIYELLLKFGENSGKKYFALTPSFIPALSARQFSDDNKKITQGCNV
jgi:hypothetical protein